MEVNPVFAWIQLIGTISDIRIVARWYDIFNYAPCISRILLSSIDKDDFSGRMSLTFWLKLPVTRTVVLAEVNRRVLCSLTSLKVILSEYICWDFSAGSIDSISAGVHPIFRKA